METISPHFLIFLKKWIADYRPLSSIEKSILAQFNRNYVVLDNTETAYYSSLSDRAKDAKEVEEFMDDISEFCIFKEDLPTQEGRDKSAEWFVTEEIRTMGEKMYKAGWDSLYASIMRKNPWHGDGA